MLLFGVASSPANTLPRCALLRALRAGYMNNDLVGLLASLIPVPQCHFLMTGECSSGAPMTDLSGCVHSLLFVCLHAT